MVMTEPRPWRGVMVPSPNPLAWIGEALRHAFHIDEGRRSLHAFADLLTRLSRR